MEVKEAKIRKTRPGEYKFPASVLQIEVEATSNYKIRWPTTSEYAVVVFQSFHDPELQDAKIQLRDDLDREKMCETKLEHGSVILVFGGVGFIPVPLDTPFLVFKFFTEPDKSEDGLN